MVVGDRILTKDTAPPFVSNCVGSVIFTARDINLVEFDWEFSGGHDGNGTDGAPLGQWGHCYWLLDSQMKKIGKYNPNRPIQTGQRVTYERNPEWGPGTVIKSGTLGETLLVVFDDNIDVAPAVPGSTPHNGVWINAMGLTLLGRQLLSATGLSSYSIEGSRHGREDLEEEMRREEEEGVMPATRTAHRHIYDHWTTDTTTTGSTRSTPEEEKFTCGICKRKKHRINRRALDSVQLTRLNKWDKLHGGEGKIEDVCADCMNRFFVCAHCKKNFLMRRGIYGSTRRPTVTPIQVRARHGNVPICQDCFHHLDSPSGGGGLHRCNTCHEAIYPGAEHYLDDPEVFLCHSCYALETSESGWDRQLGKGDYQGFHSTGSIAHPARRFGVEIEALRLDDSKRLTTRQMRPWVRYNDGSLSSGGEEFASPIFLGESGFAEVDRLLKLLNDNKYKVNSTCAVHCHIEAKDFNLRDIKRFLIFMWDYEPIIYSCLRDPCRGGLTRLCRHVSRERLMKAKNWKGIKEAIYGHKGPFEASSKWSGVRYRGLNMHSFFFRSTVECRYLGATIDQLEVANFIRLCLYSVEYGRHYPQRLLKQPIKPTLRDMAKLLEFPADLYAYLKESQIKYDKQRGKTRKEEER